MISGSARIWIVLAVALAAAGLVWRLSDLGLGDGSGSREGAGSGNDGLYGGPGDRGGSHDSRMGPDRQQVVLKGPTRADLSDPTVLRRELARRLRSRRVDWKKVAVLLERLDGPLDSALRGILLQELRTGRRNDAMVAFEALGDGTFVSDLFTLLDDGEAPRGASRAALKALARMPGADADDVARRLGERLGAGTEPTDELLRAIARRGGAEAARILVGCVERVEDPEDIPQHLLNTLELRGHPGAEDVLLEALQREQSPTALRMLLGMVSKPGATRFTTALIALDRPESGGDRARVLASLGLIGGGDAVAYLLRAADERDWGGESAARALGYVRVGNAKTCNQLLNALASADGAVHAEQKTQSLVRSLGALRHEPAVPLIARYLTDPNSKTRRASVRALGHIGAAARGHVEDLTRMYRKDDPSLHMTLAVALGKIGGSEALATMETMLATKELTRGVRNTLQRGIQATQADLAE